MKRIVLNLIMLVSVIFGCSLKINTQINEKFIGNWNFECLLTPAGFNEGLIEIKTDSVFTRYSGMDYSFSSNWVRMENDTLIFNIDINGEIVVCRLLAVEGNKLSGTAGNLEDESSLILTKTEEFPYYSAQDREFRP